MKCLFAKYMCLWLLAAAFVCGAAQEAVRGTTAAATATAEGTTASTTTTAAATGGAAASTSPKYFTLADAPHCKAKDAHLNDCLKQVFKMALIRLKDGDKSLNIPAIDPFRLNKTNIQAALGPVQGRLVIRNTLVAGFSVVEYKSLEFKEDNGKMKLHAVTQTPEVHIWGDYKADVSVNNVRMRPKGTFNLTLFDLVIDQTSEGEFYEKDGHRFARLDRFEAEPVVGNVKFNATGIFPDPSLNEVVVNILNQYWREIYRVLLPETRTFWAPMIKRVLNEALSVVPYDNFVHDD